MRWWCLILLAPLGGCQLLFGVDDDSSGEGGTGTATTKSASSAAAGGAGDGGTGGCACVDPVPADWQGHYMIESSPAGTAPADCFDGTPALRFAEGPPSAACSACTCGAVTGAQCTVAVRCFPTTTCEGAGQDWTGNFDPGGDCKSIAVPSPWSCKLGPPDAAGKCAASGGDLAATEHTLCKAPLGEGSCDAGQVCVAKATDGQVCIEAMGERSCPPGWDVKKDAYASRAGQLSCAACSCGAPQGITCGATSAAFHQFATCLGAQEVLGSGCSDVSDSGAVSGNAAAPADAAQGSCSPSGGELVSNLDPADRVTICCRR